MHREENIRYRKNMELIAQSSEDTGIPQYKLLEEYDPENSNLIYYKTTEYPAITLITDPCQYFVSLFPSLQQMKNGIRNFTLATKNAFTYYIGSRMAYKWAEFVLLRFRKMDHRKINLLLDKWQFINMAREKRLRRESNIKRLAN